MEVSKMNLTKEQQASLAVLQARMKMSELWATYWIAQATTGIATKRTIHTGYQGNHKLTPEELIEEALNTAKTHIFNIEEIASNISHLLYPRH